MPQPSTRRVAGALRLARRAWRIQYRDSQQSLALAERALARALQDDDRPAEGWARLARGFHWMRYRSPSDGLAELELARRCFTALDDARGRLLASVGIARCHWMEGRYRESFELVLPLRDEGLRVLRREERGMLLNGIAGCHSAYGQSAEAFAYMYEALRESSPAREHGFDVVLHCNLAHELYQLGDYEQALDFLREGIERCATLRNARLLGVLLGNRVVCLTDLGRPAEALPDIERVLALPADADGRGAHGAGFETLAIAALRAGALELGRRLLAQARRAQADAHALPDEAIELAVAEAESLRAAGDLAGAAARLAARLPLPAEGVSLRARALLHEALADAHELAGDAAAALAELRAAQRCQRERALLASSARQQSALLRTELLRAQQQRERIESRRRQAERAKAALAAANRQLEQQVQQVQALRDELEQWAVRDALTGLYNRRHLNAVLPSLHALAVRERAPLAVVIIDLDHFKAVNDRHGHLAGDRLLAAFGELLARRTRRSDVACRYGGEEFCLLLPRTDAHAARRKVAALLKVWRGLALEVEGRTLAGNTFSAGVADSSQVEPVAERLLAAADACALDAKRLGRNRVVVADVQADAA